MFIKCFLSDNSLWHTIIRSESWLRDSGGIRKHLETLGNLLLLVLIPFGLLVVGSWGWGILFDFGRMFGEENLCSVLYIINSIAYRWTGIKGIS